MLHLILLVCVVSPVLSVFTFRDVIVTCESQQSTEKEILFATVITTNRLKPHLPSDQKCYKISIQFSNIPILYRDSISDIETNSIHLESNNVEEVESGAFDNTRIKDILSLANNRLREVRRGIFNNVQARVLFLNHNQISYIDFQAFDNMTNLETVYLDHNKLSRIDTFWFRNTPKLKKVILNYNLITEIPANAFRNIVEKNFSAVSIHLNHNLIQNVSPYAFVSAYRLSSLDLSYNRLDSLDEKWLKGVKVDILDISNNRFHCLYGGLAAPYSRNLIDRNPWNCHCLQQLKLKEFDTFGKIEAHDSFRRCNILSN